MKEKTPLPKQTSTPLKSILGKLTSSAENAMLTTYKPPNKQTDTFKSEFPSQVAPTNPITLEKTNVTEYKNIISHFSYQATLKWLCLKGDYVFWFSWTNIFADPQYAIKVKDLWEIKEGDFLTITNRVEDIPEWFSFHPTEVRDGLAYKLLEKFNQGDFPEEPIEGNNIWRLKTGDRMVWLRKIPSTGATKVSVISALNFRENALVIGENVHTKSIDQIIGFGLLNKHKQTVEDIELARKAVDFVRQMGTPNEYSEEWSIG